MMETEIVEIFPDLAKIPAAIATRFNEMILSYLQAIKRNPRLPTVVSSKRLGIVHDDQGKVVCFFKECAAAREEAAVYLLDHPLSAHRSDSSDLLGFGCAPPTVFIRTKESSGALISYVENDGHLGNYNPIQFKTVFTELHKICIFHIRFGNADCHGLNTLTKIDPNGIHRLTPIDHEECFSPKYHVRRVWWEYLDGEIKLPFTEEMVAYVNRLDADRDLRYLKTCGWDVPSQIMLPFRIFTFFLKKAVQFRLTAWDIVLMARSHPKNERFHLGDMVLDRNDHRHGDALFLQRAQEMIETELREYARRKHGR